MRTVRQRADKSRDVAQIESQAVHSRVDLQMERNASALSAQMRLCSGALELAQLLHGRNRRGEAMPQQVRLFAGPKTRQDQDGLGYASLAQFRALIRARHAEPFGARLCQGFGNRHRAQAVSICLYNGKDLALAAHVLTDHAEIVQDVLDADFRPHGTALKLYFSMRHEVLCNF